MNKEFVHVATNLIAERVQHIGADLLGGNDASSTRVWTRPGVRRRAGSRDGR